MDLIGCSEWKFIINPVWVDFVNQVDCRLLPTRCISISKNAILLSVSRLIVNFNDVGCKSLIMLVFRRYGFYECSWGYRPYIYYRSWLLNQPFANILGRVEFPLLSITFWLQIEDFHRLVLLQELIHWYTKKLHLKLTFRNYESHSAVCLAVL